MVQLVETTEVSTPIKAKQSPKMAKNKTPLKAKEMSALKRTPKSSPKSTPKMKSKTPNKSPKIKLVAAVTPKSVTPMKGIPKTPKSVNKSQNSPAQTPKQKKQATPVKVQEVEEEDEEDEEMEGAEEMQTKSEKPKDKQQAEKKKSKKRKLSKSSTQDVDCHATQLSDANEEQVQKKSKKRKLSKSSEDAVGEDVDCHVQLSDTEEQVEKSKKNTKLSKSTESSMETVSNLNGHTAQVSDTEGQDTPKAAKVIKNIEQNELFVYGFASTTSEASLRQHFAKHGRITSLSVPWNYVTKERKGFAFVAFKNRDDMEAAVKEEHKVDGVRLLVRKKIENEALSRTENRPLAQENEMFVAQLPSGTSNEALEEYFSKFGPVSYVTLPRSRTSNAIKGYAFVAFKTGDSMEKALAEDNHMIAGVSIVVRNQQEKNETLSRAENSPLARENQVFVGQLPRHTSNEALEEYFSKFGPVSFVTLPRSRTGNGIKGYAFVAFKTGDSMEKALAEDNHMMGGKCLVVTNSREKRDRPSASQHISTKVHVSVTEPRKCTKPESTPVLLLTGVDSFTPIETLVNHFSQYGRIASLELTWRWDGICSKGRALLAFDEMEVHHSVLKADHLVDGSRLMITLNKDDESSGSNLQTAATSDVANCDMTNCRNWAFV